MGSPVAAVIPCFNEAVRLRMDRFEAFADENPDVGFLFVNDGSTDSTRELLMREKVSCPDSVDYLSLDETAGLDGELLYRLRVRSRHTTEEKLQEHPLRHWQDVAGSKLHLHDFITAALDLVAIWRLPLEEDPRESGGRGEAPKK